MTPPPSDTTAEGAAPIPHAVSTAPFDPYSVERMSAEQERYYMASQWRMMWWKFLRHRVAVGHGRQHAPGDRDPQQPS